MDQLNLKLEKVEGNELIKSKWPQIPVLQY